MQTSPRTTQLLAAEGIADYPQDLRQLSAAEWRRLFAFASSGKINATRVIKNLIWQAYTAIRDGRRAPLAGNLRSFWYTDIKPVLSRLGVPVEGRRATELVYDAFVELVTRHHLFHYRDLGFLDEGAQTRAVGQANGTVILFAEKDGRFALVREVAQAYDATALALGGYPSSLATEYLVHALQQAGVLAEHPALQLFAVVDYDPSGYWIAREFAAQLQACGVQEVTVHPLIRPERLTTEQVALGRYTLPKGSKTTNWVRETGGIDGEPYGLEADAFAPDVIRAAFVAAAIPYLRAFHPLDGLSTLLEEAARQRLDALPLDAMVAQLAALETGELLALTRHLRPRLAPGGEVPAPEVVERIVQMDAVELRELARRLRSPTSISAWSAWASTTLSGRRLLK
jgi:hypothetical protein